MRKSKLTQKTFTLPNACEIIQNYIAKGQRLPEWAQVKIFEFENQDDFLLEYIKKGGEFYENTLKMDGASVTKPR